MALKFDINKVICINLKSHNSEQLKAISETYLLSFEALKELKANEVIKIWVEIGGDWVISAVDASYPDTMYICEQYCPITKKETKALSKIKPIKTPKMKKNPKTKDSSKAESVSESKNQKSSKLTVDDILDKINISGMDSLTKEELNILKSFK